MWWRSRVLEELYLASRGLSEFLWKVLLSPWWSISWMAAESRAMKSSFGVRFLSALVALMRARKKKRRRTRRRTRKRGESERRERKQEKAG
jgi:hypothetical protein